MPAPPRTSANSTARSCSATSTGLYGLVMSTMSTSVASTLSTMTAYALAPATQPKTLWTSLVLFFLLLPRHVAEADGQLLRVGGVGTS